MTLVDTSVWIRGFRSQEPYRTELDRLLASKSIVGHPLVYGELMIGDSGGRKAFLGEYTNSPWCSMIDHEEVVMLVEARRLNGRGISWIDAHLLASAMADRITLWTADTSLAAIAEQLGVAHKGPRIH